MRQRYELSYLNDQEHVEHFGRLGRGLLFLDDLGGIENKIKQSPDWIYADYTQEDTFRDRKDYYERKGGGLAIIKRRAEVSKMPLFHITLISPESREHLRQLTEELKIPYREEIVRVLD